MAKDKETPMMSQYHSMKRSLPSEIILFFRLGDFYEMFFDDAIRAAEILDITLTKRNDIPMCGIPFHASFSYLEQLIKNGMKVAICEQTEPSDKSKGLVKREITRIVTPGTIIDEVRIEDNKNNYISSIFKSNEGSIGLAVLDLSTGYCWIEESDNLDLAITIIKKTNPNECIISDKQIDIFEPIIGGLITNAEHWTFDYKHSEELILRQFNTQSLTGLGLSECNASIEALGSLIYYVKKTLHRDLSHLQSIKFKNSDDILFLDETTVSNLELINPLYTNSSNKDGTLINVIDTTCTPMGARLIREWLLSPLKNIKEIEKRQNSISYFTNQQSVLMELRILLKQIRDIERTITRINSNHNNNPKDLINLANALMQIPDIKKLVKNTKTQLDIKFQDLDPLTELSTLLQSAIKDDSPFHIRDGDVIKDGYNSDLDDLRNAASQGKTWLLNFQKDEAEKTGIKNLKVRYNKIIGYYIEVSKSHLNQVPETYQRKQTLANAERYTVLELTEHANKILGAEERSIALEQKLYKDLKEITINHMIKIQNNAQNIAYIDVIGALAERAMTLDYVKPKMINESGINIKDGRHPVIENIAIENRFVPNDSILNQDNHQLIMITGPNMAGKSTYIRQIALITILAHMGSFVPATKAEIGLIDRVFTRIGASDDLSKGRSTFMVEMQETANILNQATSKSLIILDEIGRGTSTYDGISIACSVAEFISQDKSFLPLTLFATHYHELTDLEKSNKRIKNYSVSVKEQGKEIVFLRKIIPYPADKSYGIQVARLAGLPNSVIDRAELILKSLEETDKQEVKQVGTALKNKKRLSNNRNQLDLL